MPVSVIPCGECRCFISSLVQQQHNQKKISQIETVAELFKRQNLVKNLRAAHDLSSKIKITFVHASVFLLL